MLAFASVPALAITDEEAWQALRLQPPLPGARAAAMGGAGLALIDDPAAARANPARLASLSLPMALIEGRFGRGDEAGLTREQLLDPSVNPLASVRLDSETSTESSATPSYLAYAHPFRLLDRHVVIGGARTQMIDLSASALATTRTTPLPVLPTPGAGDDVLRISSSDLDLDIEQWSVAAGCRFSPTFAAGAALHLARLDLSSVTIGSLADPLQFTGPGMVDPTFGTPGAEPLLEARSRGSDAALGYSFGAWWKPAPGLGLGTTFRSGARFLTEGRTTDRLTGATTSFANRIRTPDAAAVGLAWTPFRRSASGTAQSVVVVLDIERVEYSDLADGMVTGSTVQTNSRFAAPARFDLDDAIEVRAGIEGRSAFHGWSLALRGGIYTEHEARPALAGTSGDVGALAGAAAALQRAGYLAEEGTEPHVTFGAGARFYELSFDLAVDVSDPATAVIVSASWARR